MVTVGVRPLMSIRGDRGPAGPVGPRGLQGVAGPQGIPGPGGAIADDTIGAALASLSSEARQGLLVALAQEAAGIRQRPGFYAGQWPSGFDWPASHPIQPSISVDMAGNVHGSMGMSAPDFFDLYSQARENPSATYYVSGNGLDTNAGTSSSAPLRTIKRAIQLAIANPPSRALKIMVDGSTPLAYGYRNGWSIDGHLNPPTDMAVIGYNGTPVVGPYADLSGMTRGTYAPAWSCEYTGSAVPLRCIDIASQDADGVHRDLTYVDTIEDVMATPGTWTYAGPRIFVRRHDDRIVDPTTTMVLVNDICAAVVGNNDTYVENIKFYGGRGVATFTIGTTAGAAEKCVFVANKCEMSYGGGPAHLMPTATLDTNGVGCNNFYGVIALVDCVARGAWKDAYGFHNNGGSPSLAVVTVNCRGLDSGRTDEGTSMNGWTLHEDIVGVDIAGQYRRSRGGTIHNIGTSRAYMLGTMSTDDAGDIDAGGSIEPVQVRASVSARIWLDRAFAAGPGLAYGTADNGQIRVRDALLTASATSGDIASY